MLSIKAFLQATRPRTYPLAMAGIFAGNATAYTLLTELTQPSKLSIQQKLTGRQT